MTVGTAPARPAAVASPGRPVGPRPSTGRYWLAALITVVGVVGSVAWGWFAFVGYQDHIAGFHREAVPGHESVALPASGARTLYFEGSGSPTLAALAVTVTDPQGRRVTVHRYSGSLRYESHDGTPARAVGTFRATGPGVYVVTSASATTHGHLAVGDSFVLRTVLQLVLGLGLTLATFGAGLGLSIVTFVQRRRS